MDEIQRVSTACLSWAGFGGHDPPSKSQAVLTRALYRGLHPIANRYIRRHARPPLSADLPLLKYRAAGAVKIDSGLIETFPASRAFIGRGGRVVIAWNECGDDNHPIKSA